MVAPVRPINCLAPSLRRRTLRTISAWERTEYGEASGRSVAAVKAKVARYQRGTLCAIERGQLLGYVDATPLAPSRYESLRSGAARDEDLASHWIPMRTAPRPACWYVGSMVVDRNLRTGAPGRADALAGRTGRCRSAARRPTALMPIAPRATAHAAARRVA